MINGCGACREDAEQFDLAMAFQPIVDLSTGEPFAYEALVRGADGRPAAAMLDSVSPEAIYAFDQQCRIAAISQAVAAGILDTDAKLSINFLPNAVYSPVACIQLTLRTARETGFPPDRLLFEFTEHERMDAAHITNIVETYRMLGFATAIDDFGAGYAGLGLLARFCPDYIKLDMELVRGIDGSMSRQVIVGSLIEMAQPLGATIIAEGVETEAELAALKDLGIRYAQGYLLAKPLLGTLPSVRTDEERRIPA